MAIIALDKKTTKFLSTAQVVTSVSTAVKELIENAFDAQANSIEVKLVDNGASLIEVSDDGRGIAKADAPFMGLQSYTSKIRDFCDLDTLESYGFRGEALSSLCSVADVTIITKTEHDEAARLYDMNEDGSITNFELSHRSVGTTIRAKSLFKDLPVRRQIITNSRRSNQDVKSLESLLRSFSICQPKIRISFTVNGKITLTKPRTETARDTLEYLFGKKFISQIDFVEKKIPEVTMQLTIPKKEATEFTEICQAGQHVFVNHRPVFYKEIEKVVNKRLTEYFGDKIPQRKKLAFLLSIEVSPSHLDVNLEPNKTSVLFTNQAKIIETLDKLLIQFYGIITTLEDISNDHIPAEIVTSPEYHDCTISEINISSKWSPMPSCKKRKVEVDRGKKVARDCESVKENNTTKENCRSNDLALNKFKEIPETISQLPVVDLGEDFSTQDISNLPNLDAGQVEAILGKTSKVNNHTSSIASIPEVLSGLTEEAWSKGHVPHLRGGTDVEIYKNVVDAEKPNVETAESETESRSTGCKGFLKFSKEFRHQIIAENPGINFVETAKALTAHWKQLSSEERGYYRDLAAEDEANIKLNDTTSFDTSKTTKRKITSENAEMNRKRFLSMLDNMKNTKIGSKKDNSGMRTIRPWTISMESIMQKCRTGRSNVERKNHSIVVGGLNENVWLVHIGVQIWALSITQLFEGLALENPNSIEKTQDSIEELIEKWLREKDDMSLLHPVFDL